MYFVRGNAKIRLHKLVIRWYQKYEQAQLSQAGAIFDLLDKKEGVLVIFFVTLTQLFLVRQFWTSLS